MLDFFRALLDSDFMPHGHCYQWRSDILWLHVTSDTLIGLAYFSIPLALLYLVRRRRDLAFERMFVLFSAFILLCGTTHFMEVWAVWEGTYRLTGVIKAVTAGVSLCTAFLLWPTIPKVLALPSHEMLRAANSSLEAEILERRHVEEELRRHRDRLEEQVRLRTQELESANERLRREVEEREQAEQAARASERRFRALYDTYHDLYENAPDLYASIDPASGHIIECNRTLIDKTGFAAEALIGRPVRMLFTEASREQAEAVLEALQRGEPTDTLEVQLRRKEGSPLETSLTLSAVHNPDGDLVAGQLSWRDITERKRLALMKDEFVSIVSHELRTPLTSINGSLGIITGGAAGEVSDQALDMIRIAQRNCERLVRLINDLLDIQKIESGRLQLTIEPIPLIALIEQSLEANVGYARQHRVAFRLDAPNGDVWVQADTDRLLQVMANLLSNAAKFSPADGTVTVSVRPNKENVRIEVTDTGEGIPSEYRDTIFEKFVQADSPVKRTKNGTGLGLNITKSIVEMLGGMIGFDSQVGRGTTFYFVLPTCPTPANYTAS